MHGVYLAVYRLFFSPIAHLPGPKLAALSFWYEFYYDVILGGRYVFKIKELHAQYGPIVRINPDELHILDPEYYDTLYSGAAQRRDKWWWSSNMFGNGVAMFSTTSHDLHRLRRSPLNQFFSKRAVSRIEPLMRELIERMCSRLDGCRGTGQAVDLIKPMSALTTDIITSYSFGTSWGCIDDPDWKWEWPQAMVDSSKSVHVNKQFPWLFALMSTMPLKLVKIITPGIMHIIQFQQDLVLLITKLMETTNKDEVSARSTIFSELINCSLPPYEKSTRRLVDEAQSIIAAGQETTAGYLVCAMYYILAHPSVLAMLKKELQQVMPDPNTIPPLAQLERLPFMRAVVLEVHRMSPGVIGRMQRISPDKPLRYRVWEIPVGTPVSMTILLQHRDPSIFPEPEQFDPTRWLREPSPERYLVPFSRGTRSCIGINLANAEIYLTLAAVFRRFDMTLHNTVARDVEVAHDYFLPHGHHDSKGVQILFNSSSNNI
ncbi:hypothetical protein PspLS_08795 [Pyricularia sp. CBS 133598]|nr:hypothetical protein PspLS_08795 [Pyricularia sp. CBS 133598]